VQLRLNAAASAAPPSAASRASGSDALAAPSGWHVGQQYTVLPAMDQVRTAPLHRPQRGWL
jgi:hypothetical protein